MSFTEKGNSFPRRNGVRDGSDPCIAGAIADALHRELGRSHKAVKTVVRWTGASERTAKNWLGGRYVPSGEHLVALVRHSDEVLLTVLVLAGREEVAATAAVNGIRERLRWILEALDGAVGVSGPMP